MRLIALFALAVSTMSLIGCQRRETRTPRLTKPIELRMAWRERGTCGGCAEYSFRDMFGTETIVYALKEMGEEIKPGAVEQVLVWQGPGERWNILVSLPKDVLVQIADFIRSAARDNAEVLLTASNTPIDIVRPDVFEALSGKIAVSFIDRAQFLSVKDALGIVNGEEFTVSQELLDSACLRLAGIHPKKIQRCKERATLAELEEENRTLDRIERELDSDHPDMDSVVRSLESGR